MRNVYDEMEMFSFPFVRSDMVEMEALSSAWEEVPLGCGVGGFYMF